MNPEQLKKDLAKHRALLADLKQRQDVIAEGARTVIQSASPGALELITLCTNYGGIVVAIALVEKAIQAAEQDLAQIPDVSRN